MECKASGNPVPAVTWSKKVSEAGSDWGEETILIKNPAPFPSSLSLSPECLQETHGRSRSDSGQDQGERCRNLSVHCGEWSGKTRLLGHEIGRAV